MRKIILSLLFLSVGVLYAEAENGVVVHQKDGTTVTYSFSKEPKLTYHDDVLVMTTSDAVVEYPLQSLDKLTFVEGSTDVEDHVAVALSQTDSPQQIYTLDGRLVRTVAAGKQLSVSGLPTGTYVVRTGKTSYKITLKR